MILSDTRLFGTNGIRGIYGTDLNMQLVIDIAYSLATYFEKGPILLGHDGRETNEIISSAVNAALNSVGLDVISVGMVPTPCLQYCTKKMLCSGGLMITASHNPPEYNGIKPISPDGVEIPREDEIRVQEIFNSKNFRVGSHYGETIEETIIPKYVTDVLDLVDAEKIKRRKLKIVMDFGNGVQACVAPYVAKNLGACVIPMNGVIDGSFPARGSEPTRDKLGGMARMVKATGADFGVAFDGDGDRSIFCDELGNIHWGDKTGTLLIRHLLSYKHRKSNVVCPINTSLVLEKICNEFGSNVIYTKVGSVEVSREMLKTKTLLGLEENGGFMYGFLNHVRDGCMTTALMMEMMSSCKESLSELMFSLPTTYQYKSKLKYANKESIQLIVNNITSHGSPKKIENLDGAKIWIDDETWIMIRASGTEPLLRIYGESTDKSLLDSKINEYTKVINDNFKVE